MIQLDLTTVSAMTALVVISAGVVFLFETVLRQEDRVGRIWALAFLSGILSAVSYVVWAVRPETWWAVAVGNACFVATTGFLWLGCRVFNRRGLTWAGPALAVVVALTAGVVLVMGEDGGSWAGAPVTYMSQAALAAAAVVECLRGDLRRIRSAVVLTGIFAVECVFFLVRTLVLLVAGEDSDMFLVWWGTIPTSILTVVLTIVAAVLTSVLRAERSQLKGRRGPSAPATTDGILDDGSFCRLIDDALVRARARGELLVVVAIGIADLRQVAAAFGVQDADRLQAAFREAVRVSAPTQAWIGEHPGGFLLIAMVAESEDAAWRTASDLTVPVYQRLAALETSVVPAIEVGVAASGSDTGAVALAEQAVLEATSDFAEDAPGRGVTP